MDFEIISEITAVETIATGKGVHDRNRLRKLYGSGRWRKRKGVAQVRLASGRIPKFIGMKRTESESENSN
jgi:hypothetical protein